MEFIKVEDGKVTINADAVKAHLKATCSESSDLSEDTTYEANNASRALVEVRRLFYGTPLEDLISEMIGVCDTVTNFAEGEE